MKYDFSTDVVKMLEEIDEDLSRQIFGKIMALPEFGDIKPLEGRHAGLFRLRVGDWRIFYAVEGEAIQVGYILPPREEMSGQIAGAAENK